ncbi:hypothetical protein [Flexithrix dorotheae]|uniref:hypothetical protein n=1 Tax=Flexithrix dorotheae TaxID=70993 RepID=UPI0003670A3A|nr:hypothetical protein [Flexithrix dorotheae]
MKRILIAFAFLSLIPSLGKISEPEIIEIRVKYQSSFSPLPEDYTINMMERKVVYTSPIIPSPNGNPKAKTKKIRGKKWKKLIALIEALDINSMNSTKGQEIDRGWYSLSIFYSNDGTKELKMWTGYTPDELLEIHQLIKFKK